MKYIHSTARVSDVVQRIQKMGGNCMMKSIQKGKISRLSKRFCYMRSSSVATSWCVYEAAAVCYLVGLLIPGF